MTENNKQKVYINVVFDNIENNSLTKNLNYADNYSNTQNPNKSINDMKNNIELLKKNIEEEKITNEKLNNILINFNKNKEITRKKNDGKIKFYSFNY